MTTKQLANILIKVLGLSLLVSSLPTLLGTVLNLARVKMPGMQPDIFIYVLPILLQAVLGLVLIAGSRAVTDILFKNDNE